MASSRTEADPAALRDTWDAALAAANAGETDRVADLLDVADAIIARGFAAALTPGESDALVASYGRLRDALERELGSTRDELAVVRRGKRATRGYGASSTRRATN